MKKVIYLERNNQEERFNFNRPGKYIILFKNLSGKVFFDIESSNVELNIYGLYIGKNQEKFEIYTYQNHLRPNSISNLLIKGIFYDSSQFSYQGLIRIEKKAQKSHAYQKNQNLILSPNVVVNSKPQLEILANDVFCTHGSTIGRLNQEQIFYLKARGIIEEKAKELLVNGFIKDVEDIFQKYLQK